MSRTSPSSTVSLSALSDVNWERDVERVPATCPTCGRQAARLEIGRLGIAPIACDFCAGEWERAEAEAAGSSRATAFAASGVPGWAAGLEPDEEGLSAFMAGMSSRGVRALWVQAGSPDAATNMACRLLRAWIGSTGPGGSPRTGAYAMETEVYSRDGIGAKAGAGMLVIDGFGRRSPTRYEAGRLRELVEHRRINRLPLVIATTLDVGRAGDVVGRVSGEGLAAMETILAMMRGAA